MHICFLVGPGNAFCFCSDDGFSTLFVVSMMPETKGISLEELSKKIN
jgi:hypothetical protein